MRKIALDLGDARIGIALSDPLCIIAGGFETYHRAKGDEKKDLTYLSDLIKKKECDTIVVGLAINMDGTEGERAQMYRAFGEKLSSITGLPAVYVDERLTTYEAEQLLIDGGMRRENRKKVIDKVAATIILQSYLDKQSIKNKKEQKMEDLEKKEHGSCGCNEEGCGCSDDKCECGECGDDCDCCDDEIITLTDDAGADVDFYQVATLDYEDKWYTFLEPVTPPEGLEAGDLVVFELATDEDGEDVFNPVEDEALLDKLFDEFDKMLDEDESED